jgi:hypothetical protein
VHDFPSRTRTQPKGKARRSTVLLARSTYRGFGDSISGCAWRGRRMRSAVGLLWRPSPSKRLHANKEGVSIAAASVRRPTSGSSDRRVGDSSTGERVRTAGAAFLLAPAPILPKHHPSLQADSAGREGGGVAQIE